jgi:predicted aspartyl protease
VSQDLKRVHRAHADTIQIGGFEFKDCVVQVFQGTGGYGDGSLGTDVFSQFLVTLDFPMHKLKLDPLPPAPQQTQAGPPALTTTSQAEYNSQSRTDPTGARSEGIELSELPDRYIAPEMKDWIPVYRMGSALMLPVSLHPPDVKIFLVDTGSYNTIVSAEAAREVTKVDTTGNVRVSAGKGKVSYGYVAEALDLRFGGISKHTTGAPAVDLDTLGLFGAVLRISGILGADILEELTIHIDYRDGLMKFEYDPKRGYHPTNR